MKSKQLIVFGRISNSYYPYIDVWLLQRDFLQVELKASSISPEQYHIIANAANKYYELVAIND